MLYVTRSGRQIDLKNMRPEDVRIDDIAASLSKLCRFGGQIGTFYSVGQHCLLVAQYLPHHLKLAGLLHDASEAYLVDLPRPVKELLPGYVALEKGIQSVIWRRFGMELSTRDKEHVRIVDHRALRTEFEFYYPSVKLPAELANVKRLELAYRKYPTFGQVEDEFLARFAEYSGIRHWQDWLVTEAAQ